MTATFIAGCGGGKSQTSSTTAETKEAAATEDTKKETAAADETKAADTAAADDTGSEGQTTITFGVFETDNITAEIWQGRSEEHTSELQSQAETLFPYTTLFRSASGRGDGRYPSDHNYLWCI